MAALHEVKLTACLLWRWAVVPIQSLSDTMSYIPSSHSLPFLSPSFPPPLCSSLPPSLLPSLPLFLCPSVPLSLCFNSRFLLSVWEMPVRLSRPARLSYLSYLVTVSTLGSRRSRLLSKQLLQIQDCSPNSSHVIVTCQLPISSACNDYGQLWFSWDSLFFVKNYINMQLSSLERCDKTCCELK